MRKISVNLDDISEKALEEIVFKNNCSTSDAVNAALLAYSMDTQPSMFLSAGVLEPLEIAIKTSSYNTVDEWCKDRAIDKVRLKYLMKRCAEGGTVWGMGNTKNKWRDKQDSREFKTHTAWIAHCLKEDFGIDIT